MLAALPGSLLRMHFYVRQLKEPRSRCLGASRAPHAHEWESFTAWCSSKSRAAQPATLAAYLSALAVTRRRDAMVARVFRARPQGSISPSPRSPPRAAPLASTRPATPQASAPCAAGSAASWAPRPARPRSRRRSSHCVHLAL